MGGSGTDKNSGVYLKGTGTIISTGTGEIRITGQGRGTGSENYGIWQISGAQVSSSKGNITYNGTGGNGTDANYGVSLRGENTKITTGTGAIRITGKGGGNGRGKDNAGVYQLNGAQVSSSNGSITYQGMGGSGTDKNSGVYLKGTGTIISTGTGEIRITGQGQGTGSENYGIWQSSGAQASSSKGNITYNGTGGNGTDSNSGVSLRGENTKILTTATGAIRITGKGGGNGTSEGNLGISQSTGAQVSSTNGSIT